MLKLNLIKKVLSYGNNSQEDKKIILKKNIISKKSNNLKKSIKKVSTKKKKTKKVSIKTKKKTWINNFLNLKRNWKSQGSVIAIGDGIAKVKGLLKVKAGELVLLNNNVWVWL